MDSLRGPASELEREHAEALKHLEELEAIGAPADEVILARFDADAKQKIMENSSSPEVPFVIPKIEPFQTRPRVEQDHRPAPKPREKSVVSALSSRATRTSFNSCPTDGNGLPRNIKYAAEAAEAIASKEVREEQSDLFGIPHAKEGVSRNKNYSYLLRQVMSGEIEIDKIPVPQNKQERAKAKQAISELTDTTDSKDETWQRRFFAIQRRVLS